MSRSLFAVSLLTLALAACQGQAPSAPDARPPAAEAAESEHDRAFAAIAARFLDEGLALSPVSATQIGDHRFDAELDDLSAGGRERSAAWTRDMLAQLDAIDAAALSRENQVDALILRNQLEGTLWDLETMQSWAWDPQVYSGLAGGAIYGLMARDFAPMPERLKSATARMEKIPALLAQARANLDPARVPRTHAETVARQNRGIFNLIDTFIAPAAGELAG